MCLVNEEPREVTFPALHVVINSYHSLRKALGCGRSYSSENPPSSQSHTVLGVLALSFADVATAASSSQRSWVSTQFTPSRRGRDTGSNMERECPLYGHSPKEASWVSDAAKGKASFWKSGHFQDTRVDMEPGHLATVT